MKNKLSTTDFRNAGYSATRAAAKASDLSQNWKANNGGKRAPLDLSPRYSKPRTP